MAQIETCDECGEEFRRRELVRKIRPSGYIAGENYLLYSSYNSSFWTCSSVDAGEVSFGLYADHFRPSVSGAGAVTEARGSQTWTATGTLRTSTATDISSLTDICFLVHVGAYHYQTAQDVSVAMGFCLSDGTGKVQEATWSFKGQKLCWFTKALADLDGTLTSSAVYFYVTTTISGASSDWWADGACLSSGTKPELYQPQTTGSQRIYTSSGSSWMVPVLCPACASDELIRPSQNTGEARFAEWEEIRDQVEDL